MKSIRFLVPVALAASALSAVPAQAESRRVSYADLDLGSPAGLAAFDRRIESAIRQLCGAASPTDLRTVHGVSRCRAETLAHLQAQRNDVLAQARNNAVQYSAR
jgi:UrcA family protein